MANILLTQRCVRSCPYCFAKKHMNDTEQSDIISWEDLIYIIDILRLSGEHHVSLLGGEPTLHPDFVDYVLYILERGFHISVFTSGIMSDNKFNEIKKYISDIDKSKISFVCNCNDPDLSPKDEIKKVEKFLNEFGEKVTISFNIYQIDFKMDFIFQYINRFNLIRNIRLGLAHPIPGKINKYIAPENFGIMTKKLSSYLPLFEKLNISVGFDCGFPMCKFSDDEIGRFLKISKSEDNKVKFICGTAIDIGPDMSVWSCFPLSNYKKRSFYEFDSTKDIAKYYKDIQKKIRNEVGGLYKECDDCKYRKSGQCEGGCLAHIFNIFQNEPKIRDKEIYD